MLYKELKTPTDKIKYWFMVSIRIPILILVMPVIVGYAVFFKLCDVLYGE